MTASRLQCGPADFLLRLRQRMPMNIGFTFTDEQLEALARAFGDRFDGRHAVDMRRRIYLPWSPYYVVIQAGRDRRTDFRRGALGIRGRYSRARSRLRVRGQRKHRQ